MARFRKRPVVIEARKFNGPPHEDVDLATWCGGEFRFVRAADGKTLAPSIAITTLEGEMQATPGDWIIRGVKGEFYPCKPDIFAATYEPVTVSDNGVELVGDEVETETPAARSEPTEHILQFFAFAHLPPAMQEVSRPFGDLAQRIVDTTLSNPQRGVALQKLLEAKDAAVRAVIQLQMFRATPGERITVETPA